MKNAWLNNNENQLEEFRIDLGSATKGILQKANVSMEKTRKFCKECKTFILEVLLKLGERLPTNKRFIKLADSLYFLKFITSSFADNAKFHFDQMLRKVVIDTN